MAVLAKWLPSQRDRSHWHLSHQGKDKNKYDKFVQQQNHAVLTTVFNSGGTSEVSQGGALVHAVLCRLSDNAATTSYDDDKEKAVTTTRKEKGKIK